MLAAPMVRVQQESTRQNHRYEPDIRPSLRDGLNGCSVLSQGTGLSCPRHRHRRRSDTSVGVSGPHVLTVRDPIVRPRAKRALRPDAATASRAPRSVTIAKRPSSERETGRMIDVICPTVQGTSCPTECDKLARRADRSRLAVILRQAGTFSRTSTYRPLSLMLMVVLPLGERIRAAAANRRV